MNQPSRRVCLVGAGNVSETHAEVLAALPGTELAAICDVRSPRARALAEQHGAPHVFDSLDDALASGTFDAAHVLVPPDHHFAVARQLLEAGIEVLIEKPMTLSEEDGQTLLAIAQERELRIGVNHNAVFYPAYLNLRRAVTERALGALQHLIVVLNFPSHTLGSPAHWMLRHPRNLAYESGIHPFSQVYDLAGPLLEAHTTVSGAHELDTGQRYYDTWQISLVCERTTAQVFLSYGGEYRMWQLTAVCEDGSLTAEVEQNRVTALDRTRWGRFHESLHVAGKLAGQEIRQGIANVAREAHSVIAPVPRKDAYFLSMRDSIASFHNGPAPGRPTVDGEFGTHVVAMCERATAFLEGESGAPAPPRASSVNGHCDVAVLGGTGFIGRALVEQLVAEGRTVRVMARSGVGLPHVFQAPEVSMLEGDVADRASVIQAIAGARTVVHLAHGGSFTWDAVQPMMVKPAQHVAEACLEAGVERLVYAGTIASLYLGDPSATITGSTPTDPRAQERGPYEWGKALSEECLVGYHHAQSLPLCIVRPGVVLGAGGTPFHSGFGIWRGETHCVGWNEGKNPLPLVLADDVAAAIRDALGHEAAVGRSYNLVGDVRLTARQSVAELRQALERPLRFHPMLAAQHQALQVSKWLAKRMIGRPRAAFPSYRAIKSMGCVSAFDCSDVKQDLGWRPVADENEFIERALRVHARRRPR